ncbi:PAS domain S-box protein [bacterium]|nr:PAS domain S-box protein [bacterium]
MRKPGIMIIHREYICAKDIQNRLRNLGYSVPSIVFEIEEIFGRIAETNPDIVLMDADVSGSYDSLDIAQDIQENFHVPVILLSSDLSNGEMHKWGYYCCSLKPIKEKELSLMIDLAYALHTFERRVYEQDQLLLKLMSTSQDGIITVDEQARVKYMNPVAERITGWACEEVQEKSIADFVTIIKQDEEHSDSLPLSVFLNKLNPVDFPDHILITREGQQKLIDLRAEPISDGDGSLRTTLFILKNSKTH